MSYVEKIYSYICQHHNYEAAQIGYDNLKKILTDAVSAPTQAEPTYERGIRNPCKICRGTGRDLSGYGMPMDCEYCKGEGYVPRANPVVQTDPADGLLPCPFCGSQPVVGETPITELQAVECLNIHCDVNPAVYGPDLAMATTRWNTRAKCKSVCSTCGKYENPICSNTYHDQRKPDGDVVQRIALEFWHRLSKALPGSNFKDDPEREKYIEAAAAIEALHAQKEVPDDEVIETAMNERKEYFRDFNTENVREFLQIIRAAGMRVCK